MDVLRIERVVEHARHRVRLADLLRLQALALEHVEKVGVAAEVELIRPVEAHSPVHEEPRQDAMRDRGPDLRLDVIADDRQVFLREALLPVRLPRDEHRNAVDERAAGLERLLHVPLRGLFASYWQVAHDNIDLAIAEDADDVLGCAWCLLHDLREILADPIVGHAPRDLHAAAGDIREAVGVVRRLIDGIGEILADLVPVDVDSRDEVHIIDVISAEVDVHDPRDPVARLGVAVVVHALNERARAVADTDDRDADALLGGASRR